MLPDISKERVSCHRSPFKKSVIYQSIITVAKFYSLVYIAAWNMDNYLAFTQEKSIRVSPISGKGLAPFNHVAALASVTRYQLSRIASVVNHVNPSQG
jgi:hypothetical protein